MRDEHMAPDGAVAWAIRLGDGSISSFGWNGMPLLEGMKRMVKLVDGAEYIYAYTTPPAAQVQQEAAAYHRGWSDCAMNSGFNTHPAGDALVAVREALTGARDWFEAQAKSISKGNGSSWDLMQVREQRDLCEAALRPSAGEVGGVSASHKKHDGPCWRNSHADCGC